MARSRTRSRQVLPGRDLSGPASGCRQTDVGAVEWPLRMNPSTTLGAVSNAGGQVGGKRPQRSPIRSFGWRSVSEQSIQHTVAFAQIQACGNPVRTIWVQL